jgi:hypothetical protein
MPPKRKAASSEVPQPAQKQKTASYMDGTCKSYSFHLHNSVTSLCVKGAALVDQASLNIPSSTVLRLQDFTRLEIRLSSTLEVRPDKLGPHFPCKQAAAMPEHPLPSRSPSSSCPSSLSRYTTPNTSLRLQQTPPHHLGLYWHLKLCSACPFLPFCWASGFSCKTLRNSLFHEN